MSKRRITEYWECIVNPEILTLKKRPTKRELLSLTMSIFDPFGFLADFMITAKLLMQRVWKLGINWDDEITDDLYHYWKKWIQELQKIETFQINRCYSPSFVHDVVDLHIFVDASEEALAAVAYWRTENGKEVKVMFVMGKTSCAPNRYHTILKLELQAAIMGVRLKNKIIAAHTIMICKVVFWSDSSAVIMWIKSDHRQYKQFVANRVSEILDSSNVEQWRWISGKNNPADEATRFKNGFQYKADDYVILDRGMSVPKDSNIRSLNPYMEEGLIRAKGRLENARVLPMSVRRPIILAKTHKLTMLIVQYYHQKLHHINRATIISEIRQKFWVVSVRVALNKVESRCQFCKNRRSQAVQPQMAPLPADRVTPYVRPFSYCGVDLFGPCYVTIRRSREKRWVAIFTCLTVRAIHLEIVANTSTDSFLLALRNFMNSRGVPVQIRSDNGTNFVGINKELHHDSTFIDFNSVTEKLGPTWH
ncbi:uncharacterized protein LOC142235696 [Haematobia irritans]|uniref:uncharacterized protein LOC142235696 n=1 Tax=Haematobia irritans TaxID=7368 RepID=UPI003F508041